MLNQKELNDALVFHMMFFSNPLSWPLSGVFLNDALVFHMMFFSNPLSWPLSGWHQSLLFD
jgi:hypothetical protein